jgi:hypothetical protein
MKSKVGERNIKTLIVFALLGIIFAFTYMIVHEQVHAAILRSYGIASITQLNWLSASTTPLNQTDYEQKCTPNCVLANNLTDVVGYHTAILIFCLTALFCFTQLKSRGDYEKENKDGN